MNIRYFIVSLYLLLNLWKEVLTHQPQHRCVHDELNLADQIPKDFKYDFDQKRHLAASTSAPIRITIDYSDLDNSANGTGMTPAVKQYLKQITQAVAQFFTYTLKVIPRSSPITKYWTGQCIDMNVPSTLVSPGISNSDLHLLVTYTNDASSSFLANAGWCQLDPNPTVGRIKYNLGTMTNINTTPEAFEGNFWTALHETTHVLGFSQFAMRYWIDPDTGAYYEDTAYTKLYDNRTIWTIANVPVLKSKKVVAAAQAYYNCPSIDGVPLENQGSSGSFGSHWERDLIANEFMTASAINGKTSFSLFTAALLIDTGYYTDFNYNFVEKTYFGSGKGCGFFTNTCKDTTQYPEFAYTGQTAYCDLYSMGGGYANTADPFSQCAKFSTYSNQICNNPTTATANPILRQIVGASTKCFQSTALGNGYSLTGDNGYRCHKFQCASDNTYIDVIFTVGTEQTRCLTPGQVINLSSVTTTVSGSITCPQDFQLFCGLPIYCPNSCSSQGFCNNGVCYCLPGYAGVDCSAVCASPNVWNGSSCVTSCPTGTFLNPNNVCSSSCYIGFYGEPASQTCKVCNYACKICTGPNNNQCSACASGYTLTGTTCAFACDTTCLTCSSANNPNACTSCNNGFYLTSGNQCQACTAPCATCQTSATKCYSCTPPANYNYNSSTNTCSLICDSSCLACSAANNPSACTSCNSGFYLTTGNQCQTCTAPCGNCQTSATTCLSCTPTANYTFNSSSNSCTLKCDSSCLTCSAANNASACSSCSTGFYLSSGNQCLACTAPCATCQTSANACLSCTPPANYTYNSSSNSCSLICHSSCLTCSTANNATSCTSCNSGFYLTTSHQCQACTTPCATCQTSSTTCSSCTPPANYNYNSSTNTCSLICDSSCLTCSAANNANACQSCNSGLYLTTGSACQACSAPCGTCQTSSTKCYSCTPSANYNYNSSTNSCSLICDSSCLTCTAANNPSACASCNSGYFLTSGNQCQVCTAPCGTCSTTTSTCLSCTPAANYNYNSSLNICTLKCDSSCLTCNSANNASACSSCNSGYYLTSASQCQQCTSPCGTCQTTATKCLSCISTTSYAYNSATFTCSNICDSSCLTCSSPNNASACSTCNNGYFLTSGNQCQSCLAPCGTCTSSASTCQSCNPPANYNYNSSTNTCSLKCDSSCLTCSAANNPNACSTCNSGYYLTTSNQCLSCLAPCGTCQTTASTCLTCSPTVDYIYNSSSNSCTLKCDTSCLSCNLANNPNACTSCNNGLFLNSSNQCQACTPPCANCQTSAITCLSCISPTNYTYNSSTHTCTSNCDSSCLTCSSPSNANACSSCNNGYYLTAGNQCQACTAPCGTCQTTATTCLSCNSTINYSYNSTSKMCTLICDSTCLTCSAANNASACSTCNSGYYLTTGNQCQSCTSPCGTCQTTATTCLSCTSPTNYTYNSTTHTCILNCDPSCLTCTAANNINACSTCNNGYYLTTGNQCQACTAPCGNCQTSATTCLSCISSTNYTYNFSTHTCTSNCDSSCLTCSSPSNASACSSCNNGYYLNSSNQCQPCTSPCGTCQTNATTCLSCISTVNYNYNSTSKTCTLVCDSTCLTCSAANNSSACSTCNSGFYLTTGHQCLACTSPCGTCQTTATTCLSCISPTNYTYNSTTHSCILNCDSSCLTCTAANNASACSTCNNGYYLTAGNQCQACTAPCGTCQTTTTTCLTCISTVNYSYNSTSKTCTIICHPSCLTCSNANNANACITCNSGFYLTSGNQCQQCTAPCGTCQTLSTRCLSCTPPSSYIFNSSSNTCTSICDSSCLTCSSSNNANACTSCHNGYYLTSSNQCFICTPPCNTCQNTTNTCLSCTPPANYNFNTFTNTCTLKCDSSCLTCNIANNSSACTSCNPGYYLTSSNQCQPCASPCGTCQTNSTTCLSCTPPANYTYMSATKTCVIKCDSSCSTCSTANNPNGCSSCQSGSYLTSVGSCQPCSSPCATCMSNSTTCLSCISTSYGYNSITNTCIFICDPSCKTCSLGYNVNACTSCYSGYYLTSINSCQACSAPCGSCQNSSTTCLSCTPLVNYNYNASTNTCDLKCDSSCLTCNQANSQNFCTSCRIGYYLTTGNQCQQCISNCKSCNTSNQCSECNSGYILNDLSTECIQQQIKCHYTCQNCQDSQYYSCSSCIENRILQKSYNSQIGQCVCPENTSDVNVALCKDTPVQQNLKTASTSVLIGSAASSSLIGIHLQQFILSNSSMLDYGLLKPQFSFSQIQKTSQIIIYLFQKAIASANPLTVFGLIEFSQTMSFFTYVNDKPALGFDQVTQTLYYSHLTKIFQFDSLVPSSNTSRNLQTSVPISQSEVTNNQKISMNGKYPYFLANSILLLILTIFIWFLSFIASFISNRSQDNLFTKIKRVFCISLPLIIFMMTSQEYSMLIFFEFQNLKFDNNYSAFSSILSIAVFLYIILFLVYLFYQIEIKRVLQNLNQNELAAKKNTQKVTPSDINLNQKYVLTVNQEKFYALYLLIKQDSFLSRNYVIILVLRKIIASIITVYGYQNPIIQLSCLLGNQALYWIYLLLVKPFKSLRHSVVNLIQDTIILIMYILYIVIIQNNDNADAQETISFVMIVLTITTVGVYFLISFVFMIQYIYSLFKKNGNTKNQQSVTVFDNSQLNSSYSPEKIVKPSVHYLNDEKRETSQFTNIGNKTQNQQLVGDVIYKEKMNQQPINNEVHLTNLPLNRNNESQMTNNQTQNYLNYTQNNNNKTQFTMPNNSQIEQINESKLEISHGYALNDSLYQNTNDEATLQNLRMNKANNSPNPKRNAQKKKFFKNYNENNSNLKVYYEQNKFEDYFGNEVIDSPVRKKQEIEKNKEVQQFTQPIDRYLKYNQDDDDFNYRQ